jgi:hypothetical protein
VKYDKVDKPKRRMWYLPHHFVMNPNKSQKIRFVFDCSAKLKEVWLNDFLLRDPVLLSNLVGVLFRSRQFKYAISADIEGMYLKIRVNPKNSQC